ncbi:MAG TPA: hypothetical protein VMV18_02240 [bacterium]|nr:hypothetical protein [bacterium]
MRFAHHFGHYGPLVVGVPATLLGWLFISICLYVILDKAGKRPGCLVWIPLLQFLPAMHAAEMSLLWLLVLLIPGLGAVIFGVVLGVGLARARKKDAVWGVLCGFPLTAPIGLLYLALAS